MTSDCDLLVAGSGFSGSILAMIARRLDLRVALVERGRHPRFAIGESASPLAGILIEQLADRYDLPRLRPLGSFGAWQRAYPEVTCGLKRGFTYFRHERGRPYRAAPDRANQLLVAASPNDELSDTHWLRADVDHFLLREAVALGADYLDETSIDAVDLHRGGPSVVRATRHGRALTLRASFIVDATGPRGASSRALRIDAPGFDAYPRTQALYSHFVGVERCDGMPEFGCPPDASGAERTPYAADDAALHHVFDGGWMWVLRFGNGVTSAGVAITDELARELRPADGEAAWQRFLAWYPSIAAQFARATPIREFTWMRQMPWRVARASGPGWAMLPSAAAFVDPLFSTGFPLTLLGIERLARLLDDGGLERLAAGDTAAEADLDRYGNATLADADHTARFVAGCYAAFPSFDRFAAYSMFYFAAASYSEMARRLGVAGESARFLCADRRGFADATVQLSPFVRRHRADAAYAHDVARAVEPLNIAGLCDPAKRNWYGVDVEDAVRGAGKLGVTAGDVVRVLALAGLAG